MKRNEEFACRKKIMNAFIRLFFISLLPLNIYCTKKTEENNKPINTAGSAESNNVFQKCIKTELESSEIATKLISAVQLAKVFKRCNLAGNAKEYEEFVEKLNLEFYSNLSSLKVKTIP